MKYLSTDRRQRGQTLIGLLIALFLLSIVGGTLYMQLHKSGGGGKSPEEAADQVACTEYVSQIRQAIMQYKQDNDGRNPPDLQSLKKYGVTSDILDAPGCSYDYDASTGSVQSGSQPAPAGSPNPAGSPGPASGQRPGHWSNMNTTTVNGPTGAPIRVPSGYGGENPDTGGGDANGN